MKKFLIFAMVIGVGFSCKNNNQISEKETVNTAFHQQFDLQPNDKDIIYYENGSVQFVQQYLNGIKHSDYKDCYNNGQVKSTGAYSMGLRTGIWKWFDEKGKLIYILDYDKLDRMVN